MGDSTLRPGIYETLLTRLLARRLPPDEHLYHLGEIPDADVPAILANHMADLIEIVLRGPSFEERTGDQTERRIAFCNELIDLIGPDLGHAATADDSIDQGGRQLLEVYRQPSLPLAAVEPLPRPTIPLS